jgi:hypothetical protein
MLCRSLWTYFHGWQLCVQKCHLKDKEVTTHYRLQELRRKVKTGLREEFKKNDYLKLKGTFLLVT